jgi:hypothetical protein
VFKPATKNSIAERKERAKQIKPLRFGVDYLDDATRGIFPDDLVLIGAPSGVGKTQLCCNIAMANLADQRRVHYIALEASEYEIERRLKFPIVAKHFYSDPHKPKSLSHIDFPEWVLGKYTDMLVPYEDVAEAEFDSLCSGLKLYYKQDRFGVRELIESVSYAAEETDLVMIDHVHYFDLDDDNENRAIKDIAKTVRSLAIENKRPIVLVAHLRKRDRGNDELCAGLEEFHGSSDLYKIATKVVTFSPGGPTKNGSYETFFRVPKNRTDGSSIRFLAKEFFDPKTGGYHRGLYEIGWANQCRSEGFRTVEFDEHPGWSRQKKTNSTSGGDNRISSYAGRREPFKD